MITRVIFKNYPLVRSKAVVVTASKYSTTAHLSQQQYNDDQLKVFRDNASKWWNGNEFKILRSMNEIRVPFVVNNLNKPIEESRIMDVGCGGGILSEPLARLGANVLGIDPVFESINEAQLHAQTDELIRDRLRYKNCNIEDLSSQPEHIEKYDALVASEVLEHIVDIESFLMHCTKVLKPGGSMFITTINQTALSWLGVIFFGETVLQQLPKGTHTYDMFVGVKGLRIMLERMGYHVKLINGFMYEPFGKRFYWTPVSLTHYAVQAVKTVPLAKGINYEQKRHKSTQKKLQKPKVELDLEELMSVIPYDLYEKRANTVIEEFKQFLENDLSTRATTSSIEKLKVTLEGLNEPLELRDIAQISLKGSNLIVINLSTMPEAVKPTMEALTNLGNTNPQVEVNNIYVPIPRVTREHRERLANVAKESANKAKDKLRALFSDFSSRAKKPGSKISENLIRSTVENLQYDINKRLLVIDTMLKTRVDLLLNQKN